MATGLSDLLDQKLADLRTEVGQLVVGQLPQVVGRLHPVEHGHEWTD